MSDNNKDLFLNYNGAKKKVNFSNNISDYKIYFLSEFGLQNSDFDNYSFFYIGQNNNQIEIKDENSFQQFSLQYNLNKVNEIFIKKKEQNAVDSGMMGFNHYANANFSTLQINNNNQNNVEKNENAPDPSVSNLTLTSTIKPIELNKEMNHVIKELDKTNEIKKQMKENKATNFEENNKIMTNNETNNELQNKEIKEIKNKENNNDNNIEYLKSKIKSLENELKIIKNEKDELIKQNSLYKSQISNIEIEKTEIKKSYEQKIQDCQNENIFNSNQLKEINKEKLKLSYANKYLQKLEEINKTKINELEKENKELKVEKNLIENSKCKTVHTNIKCMHCFINPIIGYRYKCSLCENSEYNLCQQCYEKNSENRKHPHFFYLIKNDYNHINKNDINYNINTSLINSNLKRYSYDCISTNLKKTIYRERKEVKMEIIIQNNCQNKWPANTKLINDKNKSQISTEDILLNQLAPGDKMQVIISFKNLQDLSSNEYKIYFDFNVNGINFGKQLCISIVVEKEEEKEMINKFKTLYNIPPEYKDEMILDLLIEKNENYEETFFSLFFK